MESQGDCEKVASVRKLPLFDAAKYLDSDEARAAYLSAAMETGDAGFIADAIGIVARAKGIAKIAVDTGLSREQLYRSFSKSGNPTLRTLFSVMKCLGLGLQAQPLRKRKRRPATAAR